MDGSNPKRWRVLGEYKKSDGGGNRADDGQTIQDFDGNKHRVGKKDYKKVRITPYGTRVMINGVIIADFVEGYNVEEEGGPGDPPYYYKEQRYDSEISLYGSPKK
jgi:hypothetical protein